jgi:hypothetical protein
MSAFGGKADIADLERHASAPPLYIKGFPELLLRKMAVELHFVDHLWVVKENRRRVE